MGFKAQGIVVGFVLWSYALEMFIQVCIVMRSLKPLK